MAKVGRYQIVVLPNKDQAPIVCRFDTATGKIEHIVEIPTEKKGK